MFRERRMVEFRGKQISLRSLADAFKVPYRSVLNRWNRGLTDPWELLFGAGAKPQKVRITKEQIAWLKDTKEFREGQTKVRGMDRDDEWEIACDLIGLPRVFVEEVKEALECE